MMWQTHRQERVMADRDVKALTAEIDCPVFESAAFTNPGPLAEATVAIVTTASLHHPEQPDFSGGDTSFRVLHGDRRDWQLGHWSPNFDASGFALDPNVVFPIDRLNELASTGRIGKVSDIHLAYAGNQFELSTIRLDSGPAGGQLLRDAGVNVVLLTPV
jgi:D-proline reductase (dithiol) PrdB